MKLVTLKLFVSSLVLFILTVLTAYFWYQLGLPTEKTDLLSIAFFVAGLLAIVGLLYGIKEKKTAGGKATVGIVCNSLLMLFYMAVVVIAIAVPS